jgi:hypothetical protein
MGRSMAVHRAVMCDCPYHCFMQLFATPGLAQGSGLLYNAGALVEVGDWHSPECQSL